MLGHKYISPEGEIMFHARLSNCVSQPIAGTVCLEELKALVARKCQFVSMAWRVVGLAAAIAKMPIHSGIVARCWRKLKRLDQSKPCYAAQNTAPQTAKHGTRASSSHQGPCYAAQNTATHRRK